MSLKQPLLNPVSEKGGKVIYELLATYKYEFNYNDRCYRIIIPKGYLTDIATVPRFVWTFSGILPDGLHRAAALLHDFLYQYKGKLPKGTYQELKFEGWSFIPMKDEKGRLGWDRGRCDRMFAHVMREAGVSKLKRRLMYLSVRTCGLIFWLRKN
jgi:hypothetical protein